MTHGKYIQNMVNIYMAHGKYIHNIVNIYGT